MKTVGRQEMLDAFRRVGVAPGDVCLVQSDISRIGPVEGAARPEDHLEGWWRALEEALGPRGTLAALACTESWARVGRPFHHETSPSEQGVLSEYVRTRPGAVRSLHPLFSVCAVGPRAKDICGGCSPCAFGHGSPWQRLRDMDALNLFIGVDLLAMTFVHHVEQAFGVPYSYTKEWDTPVYSGGRRLSDRFFAFVRYLDSGVEYDFSRLQKRLKDSGQALEAPLGYGRVHGVRLRAVFDQAMACLHEDVFFLLAAEPDAGRWKGPK